MPTAPSSLQWCWGLAAAFAMPLQVLGAQFLPWKVMGKEWAGSYFSYHSDEAPYAAYVQALIEGRPRRNDPYSGRNDKPGSPQPESLFSIQFAPAYMVALPTRVLGISAQSAFIRPQLFACHRRCARTLLPHRGCHREGKPCRYGRADHPLLWFAGMFTGNCAVRRAVQLSISPSFAVICRRCPFHSSFSFCGLVWIAGIAPQIQLRIDRENRDGKRPGCPDASEA